MKLTTKPKKKKTSLKKKRPSSTSSNTSSASSKSSGRKNWPLSPKRKEPILLSSRYRTGNETIFFDYPDAAKVAKRSTEQSHGPRRLLDLKYKTYWMRNSVKAVFREAGFARCLDKEDNSWDVLWGKHLPNDAYRHLPMHKRVNSFPGTGCIGAKDRCATLFSRFQRRLRDDAFSFLPETHIIRGNPMDIERFYADVERQKNMKSRGGKKKKLKKGEVDLDDVWICKPQGGSCGRGIKVMRTKDVKNLPLKRKLKSTGETKNKVWNVQRYIGNPCLIDNRKFDCRFYVMVTSFNPLRVYMYNEGMVRLCTHEYNLNANELKDSYKHLTNYSINKNSDDFVENRSADEDDTGSKQSFSSFLNKLKVEGRDTKKLLRDIQDVAAKTLIAAESECYPKCVGMRGRDECCFELFGFDLMFDENLKVYLIEVNIYPSMMSASPFDKRLKYGMLTDALHIVGVPTGAKSQTNQSRRDILLETKEEFDRASTTNFTCVYPNKRTVKTLDYIFESRKSNNDIIKNWIMYGNTDANRVEKKKGQQQQQEQQQHDNEQPMLYKDDESRSTISSSSSIRSNLSNSSIGNSMNSGISYY